eukprot:gnl/TRDRNA2_/TRDRNA2_99415_c0_seq1.p1 gnl/TRDRNA2_/TRDRNA2_99415_c0~~gnl/TRDRNA2_/TRDRNA2_99415_c0_seq1.p1  ORF type:complete len:274 (-),score=13.04 gnl/TRDRNA2_/TRDRNA2_99415_c0_seq1:142-963(-)
MAGGRQEHEIETYRVNAEMKISRTAQRRRSTWWARCRVWCRKSWAALQVHCRFQKSHLVVTGTQFWVDSMWIYELWKIPLCNMNLIAGRPMNFNDVCLLDVPTGFSKWSNMRFHQQLWMGWTVGRSQGWRWPNSGGVKWENGMLCTSTSLVKIKSWILRRYRPAQAEERHVSLYPCHDDVFLQMFVHHCLCDCVPCICKEAVIVCVCVCSRRCMAALDGRTLARQREESIKYVLCVQSPWCCFSDFLSQLSASANLSSLAQLVELHKCAHMCV